MTTTITCLALHYYNIYLLNFQQILEDLAKIFVSNDNFLNQKDYTADAISKLIYKDNYKINHEGRQIKLTETQTES